MPRESSPLPPFSEREFYLSEFRGRTLAFALPAASKQGLAALAEVLEALVKGGSRSVVLVPSDTALDGLAALPLLAADTARLEGKTWRALRERGRVAIVARGPFPAACREIVGRLGIHKLVWTDPQGGLADRSGGRISFCDLAELRRLLTSPGLVLPERVELCREIEAMLEAGIAAVNVCTVEGLDDELFSYAGSGTLFTRKRYVSVRKLGVDEFDAACDLIARGVTEGYLAPRTPEEVDLVLASGFGAFVEGRHLAGLGALLVRSEGGSGEIASLYTLTRFLGEGVGAQLLGFVVERARALGLGFVFACTTSDRVGSFFEGQGFRRASPTELPAAKWQGYPTERRTRLRCYRRDL